MLLVIFVGGYKGATMLLAVKNNNEQQLWFTRRAPCYSVSVYEKEYMVAYTKNLAPCLLLSGHEA